jgi:hypothetical protein
MITLEKLIHLPKLLLVADASSFITYGWSGIVQPIINCHGTVISVDNSFEKVFVCRFYKPGSLTKKS